MTSLILHKKALAIVQKINTNYCDLIDVLEQILITKSYFDFNMKSAFQYATEKLGISKEQAQACIRLSRVTLKIPALKEKVRYRHIDFWKAVKICSVITVENQEQWMALAAKSSKSDLELEIAKTSPKSAIRDKATVKVLGTEVWH